MKAWENEPRVRPIRIEDDDGVPLPDAGGPGPRPEKRRHRPWTPLVASGLAVVAVIAAVALLGAVELQDSPVAEPESFTPTTKADTSRVTDLPQTLEETVPGITDRLTLLTTDGRTIWTVAWDPSTRAPRTSVAITNKTANWTSASFDTGGRLVAALSSNGAEGGTQQVMIGSPMSIIDIPRLDDVTTLQWHSVDVGRFAFARAEGDYFTLETVEIDFLTQTPREPNVVRVLNERPHIIRWDNDGFILQVGNRTVALDTRGNQLWSTDGWARDASPGFVPQVRETDNGVRWFLIDRETGEATSLADLGINDSAEATDVITSKNSNVFAAATHRKEATTVTVGGFSLIAPVTAHIFEDVNPYQFSSDAALLILTTPESSDLTFLDWRQGVFHSLEIPEQDSVLAINVG